MILFIDDEPDYVKPFLKAFELSGFPVYITTDLDNALTTIESQEDDILAIILDIMMPPGKLFDLENTDQGLRTGLRLLEHLKEVYEKIPVVILTNLDKSRLGKITHGNCLIFEKKEITPWELVNKVANMKRKVK